MMQENFLITITNQQRIDNETDQITLTTKGSYTIKDGKRYLMYREYNEDGSKGQTSTLKIDRSGEREMVTLIRHDPVQGSTNLMLEEGARHQCQYGTPYGSLSLGVFTSRIVDNLTDAGGDLLIEYTLDVNASLSSVNAITVTVKPAAPDTLC